MEDTPPALPPIEAAFSIEKIHNAVFSLLEPWDLLQCRLVSSSWRRMATNDKLIKWNKNAIEITYDLYQQSDNFPDVKAQGEPRRLKDFTHVLDGLGSNPLPLPWSASLYLQMELGHINYLEFFDRYGFVVNSLHITLNGTKVRKLGFVYDISLLLKFFTKILTEQMPNLESLTVSFGANAKFTGEIESEQLEQIKEGSYLTEKQNQNLRFIQINVWIPYEIIDALCCLAPKLEELLVYDSLGIYKNRLHLLKKLTFEPQFEHWDKVDAFEAALDMEDKINLKEFVIDFSSVREEPDQWPRFSTLVTKILEKSCDSLEELVLNQMFFLPGTVLPKMPKVKKLTLTYVDFQRSFWPQVSSVASTFPALQAIYLEGDASVVTFLVCLCGNEEVKSVKRINHIGVYIDHRYDVIKSLFPNATVTGMGPIVCDNLPRVGCACDFDYYDPGFFLY